MDDKTLSPAEEDILVYAPARAGLLAFGWLNIGLGVLGTVLPVMPATVFLLIALWAFSRSSLRFHRWLFDHPTLGRTIREWHGHRVIPVHAKFMAAGMMTSSLIYVTLFVAEGWALPVILAMTLGTVFGLIVSRPSRVSAKH